VVGVGGLRAAGAALEVLHRGTGHPEQEQVQHGEEAELERDGDGVEGHGQSWSNPMVDVPSSIVSPGFSDCAPWMRRPLTLTPLVEPRSLTIHLAPLGRTSACLRDTFWSESTTSHSRERPITPPPPLSTAVLPSKRRRAVPRRWSGSRSSCESRS